jgi:hypothetical protein
MIYAVDRRINLASIVTMKTLVPRITRKDSAVRLIVNETLLVDILSECFYNFKHNLPMDFLSGNSVRTSVEIDDMKSPRHQVTLNFAQYSLL